MYIQAESFSDEMNALNKLVITDDGDGVKWESIDDTFGTFLVSQKEKNVFFDKQNQGKGRYAFSIFSNMAKWTTVCKKEDSNYKYEIIIRDTEKEYLDITAPIKTSEKTGTSVEFFGIKTLKYEDIVSEELENKIITYFAKYLYMYKNKKIFINGKELSYSKLIDEKMSESFEKEIDGNVFRISFIKWLDGSNQKSFVYYTDEKFVEKHREHTKCNNNTVKFYHSLFVTSKFFDNFKLTDNDNEVLPPFVDQNNKVFKQLHSFVFIYVKDMLKKFIREEVPGIVQSYIKEGLFPDFCDDPYSQAQKEDLTSVVEEIYCIQPGIFYRTKKEHKKAIIGCLNLILKTEERENIITILDSIQKLTTDERAQLANILRRYEPSSVIRLLETVKARQEIITELKTLIYDNTRFTNERNHIQKIIEQNYWLFGEEYALVSADERLATVLNKYLNILDKGNKKDVLYTDPKYKDKRPDIFISGNQDIVTSETQIQENIIVELKAPSVRLTTEVYRQIEDYMLAVNKDPEFMSSYRQWKFICVCNEIDDEVKVRYKSMKEYGKKCLVFKTDDYEIYAYTWADIFTIFELKHNHLYKKLKKKFEYSKNVISPSRELADNYTMDIVEKGKFYN